MEEPTVEEWINAQLESIGDQEADHVLMVMVRRIDGEHEPTSPEVLRVQLQERTRRLVRLVQIEAPPALMIREYRLIGRVLAQMEVFH